MVGSLHALLHRAFDDAALFPPSALPLSAAAAGHVAARSGAGAEFLGRFVCPVAWLPELGEWLNSSGTHTGETWPISVLGTSLEGFRQDLLAIERFESSVGERALVDAYEVKAQPSEVNLAAVRALANAGFEDAYVELPWDDASVGAWHVLAESDVVGAKARLGGLEASAFPPSVAVARFLREVVSLDLPFKLTAGLHQALPHPDARTGAAAHGFIAVLVAGTLASVHDLSTAEVVRILDSADPSAFWFTERGLGWRDWEADLDDVREFRMLFGGLGTCSLSEPLESLTALGW